MDFNMETEYIVLLMVKGKIFDFMPTPFSTLEMCKKCIINLQKEYPENTYAIQKVTKKILT